MVRLGLGDMAAGKWLAEEHVVRVIGGVGGHRSFLFESLSQSGFHLDVQIAENFFQLTKTEINQISNKEY